jgi:formylglycine-generating enzyme required for sulfatase activity
VLANPEWQKGRIDRKYHDGDYLKDWSANDYPSGKGNHPVAYVSWYAAKAYAQWAGKRLPAEAEWEFACRAGTSTAYWWGESFDENRANNGQGGTAAVGEERHKNAWGLYDMLGNVWEWTSSLYREYPYRSDDGRENQNASGSRVLRGGSWTFDPWYLRSGIRLRFSPEYCFNLLGFRCAR